MDATTRTGLLAAAIVLALAALVGGGLYLASTPATTEPGAAVPAAVAAPVADPVHLPKSNDPLDTPGAVPAPRKPSPPAETAGAVTVTGIVTGFGVEGNDDLFEALRGREPKKQPRNALVLKVRGTEVQCLMAEDDRLIYGVKKYQTVTVRGKKAVEAPGVLTLEDVRILSTGP